MPTHTVDINSLETRNFREILIDTYVEGELLREAKANGKLAKLRRTAAAKLRDLSPRDIDMITAQYLHIMSRTGQTMFYSPYEVVTAFKKLREIQNRGVARAEWMDIEDMLKELNLGTPLKGTET